LTFGVKCVIIVRMIKELRSEKYKVMSKFEAFEILHKYLDVEKTNVLKEMMNKSLYLEPRWAEHQVLLLASLTYIEKIKAFLPNQGKE
jgi:hypothetical protein